LRIISSGSAGVAAGGQFQVAHGLKIVRVVAVHKLLARGPVGDEVAPGRVLIAQADAVNENDGAHACDHDGGSGKFAQGTLQRRLYLSIQTGSPLKLDTRGCSHSSRAATRFPR
jgi:hypothetical protein